MKDRISKIYDWLAHQLLACGADKWAHFTISLIATYLCASAVGWMWGFGTVLAVGVLKEYAVDGWLRGGKADWADIRADFEGAATGALLMIL